MPTRLTARGRWAVGALAASLVGALAWVLGPQLVSGEEPTAADDVPATRVPALPGTVRATFGVATFNVYWHLSPGQARADWRRLAAVDGIDLIGWQETNTALFREMHSTTPADGWQTWTYPGDRLTGPRPLAVSWRPEVFRLDDVSWRKVHGMARAHLTDAPSPPRWILQAEFTHLATGRTVTLLNTHVDSDVETGQGFQDNLNARAARRHYRMLARMWNTVPGDVVVGTGDYNFDHHDDARARPAGGITDVFAGKAVSSYEALGYDHLAPTRATRWIDYVFLATDSLRTADGDGVAQFAGHRVLESYESDHRPLLARVRLYA